MKLTEITMRDPFFFKCSDYYLLFGSTDKDIWDGKGTGFQYYKSYDLKEFDGPYQAFTPSQDFWADENFWAPEVWQWNGVYYMIASFKKKGKCRGVQILKAEMPEGPYEPVINQAVTPADWDCLDGTLCFDGSKVYLVFCREWTQIGDGQICAAELSKDFTHFETTPKVLFKASDAPWSVQIESNGCKGYVTDGPFLWRDSGDILHMIWSSFDLNGYSIGLSHGNEGLFGKWIHEEKPLLDTDGGHGMLFHTFDGKTLLTVHSPNERFKEHPVLYPLTGDIFSINAQEDIIERIDARLGFANEAVEKK